MTIPVRIVDALPRQWRKPAKPDDREFVAIAFTHDQMTRLRAGARFFGLSVENLCVAGGLSLLDQGSSSEANARASVGGLVRSYAKRRVTFYDRADGTRQAVQLSRFPKAGR